MNFKPDTYGTLYRKDPQYIDKYGTPGIRLSSRDALVELEAIPFIEFTTKTQFLVRCIERKNDGKAILPIDESDLKFEFLEAYGFLFPIYKVDKISDQVNSRMFAIALEFDPDFIGERIIHPVPLIAIHIGDNNLELDKEISSPMLKPFCLRSDQIEGEKMLQLEPTKNSRIYKVIDSSTKLDNGERVKILTNWNPSAIKAGKK